MTTRPQLQPENKPESILSRLSEQLTLLERRDFEQWVIVVGTGILVGAGLVVILFPGAIERDATVHFELSVSRELFLALVVLLILFNTYMISNRLKLRRVRGEVISTAIQSELLRLQSFSDPLTEVYNRRSLEDMLMKYTRRAQRLEKPLSFLMIDVDRFRESTPVLATPPAILCFWKWGQFSNPRCAVPTPSFGLEETSFWSSSPTLPWKMSTWLKRAFKGLCRIGTKVGT